MSEVIQLIQSTKESAARVLESRAPAVRTEAVNVVFTTADETLEALRVASVLGKAMAAPLTLVHFRPVPYALSLNALAGVSPTETDEFVQRVRSEGIDVRVRVYLCRDEERVIPMAFKCHSIIVIGGHRSWWPTIAERRRRRLEAAGHFVVFVDAPAQKEAPRA
jgi:hypothetical protein